MSSSSQLRYENLSGLDLADYQVAARSDSSETGVTGPSLPLAMETRGLVKNYRKGKLLIKVLQSVDFAVSQGEFQAVIGQSGSGKSKPLKKTQICEKKIVPKNNFYVRKMASK